MKNIILYISCILLFLVLLYIGLFPTSYTSDDEMIINDIDLSAIDDGLYKGSYKFSFSDKSIYHVITSVKDHRIKKINLQFDEKIKSRFTTMAKDVFERIIDRQTPNVDVVTGASITSKQYMKAIENSLLKPEQ